MMSVVLSEEVAKLQMDLNFMIDRGTALSNKKNICFFIVAGSLVMVNRLSLQTVPQYVREYP